MPRIVKLPVTITGKTGTSSRHHDLATARHRSHGQKAGRWKPGTSGNPRGRPAGSRNHAHLRLQNILMEDAELVLRRMIQAALSGDVAAGKIILDRVICKRVCRPLVGVALPNIQTISDACTAMGAIAAAAVAGLISTTEAAELAQVVENFRRVIEATEFNARLELLEQRLVSKAQ